MPLTIPPGVDANGRRNFIFVPTNSLSVAVLTGSTAVDLACYLTKGTFGVTSDTQRGTDERECTLVAAEVMGNTTYSMNDLEYVWEPQDTTANSTTNQALNKLGPRTGGATGFIIVRYGIQQDTALAAGQLVDQLPVTLGPQLPASVDGSNPAEKLKITQAVVIGQGAKFSVPLVA
ncbi:MAG: hypothetical protein HOQ27_10650 [Dermatophilaceae bacterium]|nr:hypothetical protein [Dermatophilaceae bacterium]